MIRLRVGRAIPIVILLGLATMPPAAACQMDSVEAVYDRITDSTAVHMYGIPVRLTNELPSLVLPPDTLMIFGTFSLPGHRERGWPDSVSLRFSIEFSTFGAADPPWRFSDDHQGTILLGGGRRLPLGTGHYKRHVYGARAIEDLWFDVPTAEFLSIATAANVEGRIGSKEFALDARALTWLRMFGAHIGDAAPQR